MRRLSALAICLTVFAGVASASASSGVYHDARGDESAGGASRDLVRATYGHVHGKTNWLRHDVSVRGDLGPRKNWPWLWIDVDGTVPDFFLAPTYHGGTLIDTDLIGSHLAPVKRIDHNTLRFQFKTRWLDDAQGANEYCWYFAIEPKRDVFVDVMPDRIKTDGGPGYRHELREGVGGCRYGYH